MAVCVFIMYLHLCGYMFGSLCVWMFLSVLLGVGGVCVCIDHCHNITSALK